MSREIKYADIDDFTGKLEKDDYNSRQNYFRWMEYPLALNLLDAAPGMKVLEVGAGFISIPSLFLVSEKGCEVTAIDKRNYDDQSRHYIEKTRARLKIPKGKLNIMTMDAEKLDFPDNTFDRVSAISMIEHLPLFKDAIVLKELGRVLKPGGKLVLTVPFNLGHHIETETWGGDDYEQRHYNDYTIRERLINPTLLYFVRAVAFGEIDDAVGKNYLKLDQKKKLKFCLKNKKKPLKYWREYYKIEKGREFVIHKSELPVDVLKRAGVIAIVLEKRETSPAKSDFPFSPFKSYLENQKLCKTKQNWPSSLTIDKVSINNVFENELYVFESGETMEIKLNFTCYGKVVRPTFYVMIQDKFDNMLFQLNTVLAGIDFGVLTGKQIFSIKFGMLNLLPGEFKLSVGAWEYDSPNPLPPYPYDAKYQFCTIKVRERHGGEAGAVYMPYELKIEKVKEK